jgi:hypothetical protein
LGWKGLTHTAFKREEKFRDEFWSARWVGMITPKYAERYTFTVKCDSGSFVRLYIGGIGTWTNESSLGDIVFSSNQTSSISGKYTFIDTFPKEFVLEYAHYTGEAYMTLQWRSPSTPDEVIPSSAFTHWRNISFYNTTVHPAALSPHHCTAYAPPQPQPQYSALERAQVAAKHSFVVYARDRFGNLLQRGGDVPSMVAVGPDGVAFRGDVTDYENSTYLIEYYPTVAGVFRMYVTVGCCPPHPNVGLPAELEMASDLQIMGSPFLLTVTPADLNATRTSTSFIMMINILFFIYILIL